MTLASPCIHLVCQVHIFTDEECTSLAEHVRLAPRAVMQTFIALRPFSGSKDDEPREDESVRETHLTHSS